MREIKKKKKIQIDNHEPSIVRLHKDALEKNTAIVHIELFNYTDVQGCKGIFKSKCHSKVHCCKYSHQDNIDRR